MRLLPLLLPLALGAGPGSDLATDYGKLRTLRTTSELALELETTSMEMTIDDEPAEDRGPGGMSSSLVRRAVLVDQVLEGAAGEPARVKRTFETLHDAFSFSFGEDEHADERDHPLQGVTLELAREEDGTVSSELVEGTEPEDDALLEDHGLALALDALLPSSAVEVGATWELDDEALQRALATALDRRLFPEPPPEESGRGERGGPGRGPGRGGPARSLGLVAWKGTAKLEALDAEHEGEACARITLELEGSGAVPEPPSRGPGGRGYALTPVPPPAAEGTVEAQLEGELLFAIGRGRPLFLKLAGEVRIENRFERERDGRRFSMHSQQAGDVRLTVQVEE